MAESVCCIGCWALSVERWMFASSSFQPFFPSAFEHEDGVFAFVIFELRFFTKSARNFGSGVTTLRTTVNDYSFFGRPLPEKLREQFVPTVFIQQNRARNMIVLKILSGPGINPHHAIAPASRLIDGNHL